MSAHKNAAQRRYLLRLAVAMASYIVTLTIAVRFVGGGIVVGPMAYALALLPGLSIAGVFWAVGRLVQEEQDEYQRMLLVRQILVATGFTLSLVTVWGFLENFGLVHHVDAFYVAVLWFVGLGVGKAANMLILRDKGDAS